MTKDEVLRFEPPAARLLGREVISLETVAGAATLSYKAQPEFLNLHGATATLRIVPRRPS